MDGSNEMRQNEQQENAGAKVYLDMQRKNHE